MDSSCRVAVSSLITWSGIAAHIPTAPGTQGSMCKYGRGVVRFQDPLR